MQARLTIEGLFGEAEVVGECLRSGRVGVGASASPDSCFIDPAPSPVTAVIEKVLGPAINPHTRSGRDAYLRGSVNVGCEDGLSAVANSAYRRGLSAIRSETWLSD